MAKIKAKLRSMNLRGETTTTRWGDVTFSRDGLAELEVEEEDLHLLRGIGWLVEAPTEPQDAPEGAAGKNAASGEGGAPSEPSEVKGTGEVKVEPKGEPKGSSEPKGKTGGFDTSDAETPPHGNKAHKTGKKG